MAKKSFSFDHPNDSPGFLLWQTMTLWQRKLKNILDAHNLAHTQFVIMALLLWFKQTNQEATQKALIARSKLDKMTVSKSLKILAHQKLIKRTENKIDTRVKNASLTEKGKKLIESLIPHIQMGDNAFFEPLKPTELRAFIKSLQTLITAQENQKE